MNNKQDYPQHFSTYSQTKSCWWSLYFGSIIFSSIETGETLNNYLFGFSFLPNYFLESYCFTLSSSARIITEKQTGHIGMFCSTPQAPLVGESLWELSHNL